MTELEKTPLRDEAMAYMSKSQTGKDFLCASVSLWQK